jgi:cysteine desulfurase
MPIYLDYNATAPIRPQVAQRISELLAEPLNPSSVHGHGRRAKKLLEDARKTIAECISAFPNEIIFTATGTEANVMALTGFPQRRVLVNAVEHSSVLSSLRAKRSNPDWIAASPSAPRDDIIPVHPSGLLNLDILDRMLSDQPPALVSIQLANNETGIIQPIAEIAELCRKHGALLHMDAVQALGKIPVDFSLLGADMMTLSAHKMGGPVGAACLVIKQSLAIQPIFVGGQELRRRAGTENIPAICGFAKAAELMDLSQMKTIRNWLDTMEKIIASPFMGEADSRSESEGVKLGMPTFPPSLALPHKGGGYIVGESTPRLPNTSCIIMPGISSEVQLMNADLAGFAVSAGSACSSGRVEPSHVLRAMGVPDALAGCAIRVSAGWNTAPDEIQAYTKHWENTYCRLAKSSIIPHPENS